MGGKKCKTSFALDMGKTIFGSVLAWRWFFSHKTYIDKVVGIFHIAYKVYFSILKKLGTFAKIKLFHKAKTHKIL